MLDKRGEAAAGPEGTGARFESGDLLKPFPSRTIGGAEVRYEQLWQHRNIVLFVVPAPLPPAATAYLDVLDSRLTALAPDTSLVLSHHIIDGAPLGSLVIADRWGEVVHSAAIGLDSEIWPTIDDVVEWVQFVRMKCPECPP